MNNYLWKINKKKLLKTNLSEYADFLKKNYKFKVNNNFDQLWKWSIKNPKFFWSSIWDFTKIVGFKGDIILKKSKILYICHFQQDQFVSFRCLFNVAFH